MRSKSPLAESLICWATSTKNRSYSGFYCTPDLEHNAELRISSICYSNPENDARLEHAQQMAGHESPRTTKLYDRTKDEITLSEVERIRL